MMERDCPCYYLSNFSSSKLSSVFVSAFRDMVYQFYWSFLVSRITRGVACWWLAETLWSFLCLMLPECPFLGFGMLLARGDWRSPGRILEHKRWKSGLCLDGGAESQERVCLIAARWTIQASKCPFHFLAKTVGCRPCPCVCSPPPHFAPFATCGKIHCWTAASVWLF